MSEGFKVHDTFHSAGIQCQEYVSFERSRASPQSNIDMKVAATSFFLDLKQKQY